MLGAVTDCGPMSFVDALAIQGSFYADGTDAQRAVFQIDRLPGDHGDWWATVEPNGYRMSFASNLQTIAAGLGVAFFWNVNAVMRLLKVEHRAVVAEFDPLLDIDQVPDQGQDLPFETMPHSSSMTLLHRWTGVKITQQWFDGSKATLIIDAPVS
jgi:hypothetical protein